jgi:hypothetical protein
VFGQKGKPKYSIAQQNCLSIPTKSSSGQKWKSWHQSLVTCFGKQGANTLWVEAWDRYGRNGSAYSQDLAQYMQGKGVYLPQGIGQRASLSGANIVNGLGGFFNVMKYINIALAGGIAIGFLMLLYNIIMNPDKAKKSLGVITEGAMMVTPQGRIAGAAKKSLSQ